MNLSYGTHWGPPPRGQYNNLIPGSIFFHSSMSLSDIVQLKHDLNTSSTMILGTSAFASQFRLPSIHSFFVAVKRRTRQSSARLKCLGQVIIMCPDKAHPPPDLPLLPKSSQQMRIMVDGRHLIFIMGVYNEFDDCRHCQRSYTT
jgi:hypothetical protein